MSDKKTKRQIGLPESINLSDLSTLEQSGAISRPADPEELVKSKDISRQHVHTFCSPREEEAITGSRQKEAIVHTFLQQQATSLSPPRTHKEQGGILRSYQPQQERAISLSPHQQAAIHRFFQQQAAIHIPQPPATFRRSSPLTDISQLLEQSRLKRSISVQAKDPKPAYSRQQVDLHSPQSERELVVGQNEGESQPSSPDAHKEPPEAEIRFSHERQISVDIKQPETEAAAESLAARIANRIDNGLYNKKFYMSTFAIGLIIFLWFTYDIHFFFIANPSLLSSNEPISSRLTAKENEAFNPKSLALTKHLQQLYRKEYNLNPCNSLHTLACDARHKRSDAELLEWPLKSRNSIPTKMEESIKQWVTDKRESKSFTQNFLAVKKFYHFCITAPDTESGRFFYQRLKNINVVATSKNSSWVDLTFEALNIGLFANVFLELPVVDTDEGLATFEVTFPSTVTTGMYVRMWHDQEIGNLKTLAQSWMTTKVPFRNKNLQDFAMAILNLVNEANDIPEKSQQVPINYLNATSLMEKVTGSKNPRFKISPKVINYLNGLNVLISKTDLDIVVAYFKVMVIIHDCLYLPNREENGCMYFHQKRSISDLCYSIARNSLWFQGVHVYQHAKNYMSFSNVNTIKKIEYSVKKTLHNRLVSDRWLNSIAVNGALKHLNSLNVILDWDSAKNYEQLCNPHLSTSQFFGETRLISFVTAIRRAYKNAEILKTNMSAVKLEMVNRFQRPKAFFNLTNYYPLSNKLVVNPVAFEMLLTNDQLELPFFYHMATLGTWITTAILKTFDFSHINENTCISPSGFWKYNVKLYFENLKNCTEIQYNEYRSKFNIQDDKADLILDYKSILDIISPRLAFSAYRHYVKKNEYPPEPVYVEDLTAEQAFWLILTSYRCDPDRKLSTDYLSPNFSTVGPAFTSREFDYAFNCKTNSKMLSRYVCLSFPF